MNSDEESLYDNDYTTSPESNFLDNSITDEMQRPDPEQSPVIAPSEEDINGNAE